MYNSNFTSHSPSLSISQAKFSFRQFHTRPSIRRYARPRANRLRGSEVLQLLGGLHRPCGVVPSFSGPPRRSSKRRSSAAWAENARRGTCGRVCLPRRSRECTPGTTCNGISSAFLSWCSALARCRGRPFSARRPSRGGGRGACKLGKLAPPRSPPPPCRV